MVASRANSKTPLIATARKMLVSIYLTLQQNIRSVWYKRVDEGSEGIDYPAFSEMMSPSVRTGVARPQTTAENINLLPFFQAADTETA